MVSLEFMRKHIVEGVEFINLSSVAKEYGLSKNSVYKRYSRGHRGDNLIPNKKRKKYIEPKKKYKFVLNGIGFKSYAQVCKKYNVHYGTFLNRINGGITIPQALGIEKRTYKRFFRTNRNPKNIGIEKGKKTIIDGQQFKSISKAARAYNITGTLLANRVRSGQTLEQAVGLKPYETKTTVKYKGKIYKNYADLAKEYNITHKLLYGRISRGLSISEAIGLGNKFESFSPGRFNEKVFKKNPALASKSAFLYFVLIIIDGKERYKIGITTQKIKKRLKLHDFKILKSVKSSLLDCYLLEQKILKSYTSYLDRDITPNKLDGYREVFNFPQEIVGKVFKDLEKSKN